MMKKIILGAFLGVFCLTTWGYGAQPIDQIKGPIEKGIAVLKDPQYKADKDKQREKIWGLIQQIFDFKAVSMRALAQNWRSFDSKQKQDFTEAFTDLLKDVYMDKIQGQFHNEEVVFLGQDMISDKKAVVKSKVLRKKVEIPMDYSVFLYKDKWWVYDVKIEGISMVKNYRTQFNEILSKDSPEQLIQKIKEKSIKLDKEKK